MRWCVLLLLIACIFWASVLHADMCVKKIVHRDEYYSSGVVTPASDVEIEVWFSEKRMAYHGDRWLAIVDADKNVLCIASMSDSVFFEFPLPVVCKWIGNSPKVAEQHYLQQLEKDFERAASTHTALDTKPADFSRSVKRRAKIA